MIVIRNVFRLKFGKAREAVALFKEGIAIQKRVGAGAVYCRAPMEVRAGDAAGGADFAEHGAGVDEVARLDGK